MAEIYFREGLRGQGEFDVASAGTGALVGKQMDPGSQEIVLGKDLTLDPIPIARQLTSDLVDNADLILCMDRGHRTWVLERFPRVKRRTFTIYELAVLIRKTSESDLRADLSRNNFRDSSEMLAAGITSVRLSRGALGPSDLGRAEDIVDPYGLPAEVFKAMDLHLAPCCETVIEFLNGLSDGRYQSGEAKT